MTTHATDPELLRSSLSSALNQSLRDLEVVVVVDGKVGPDLTEVLGEFDRDPRVRVLQPGRVGRGAALNIGLADARAEFIAIQDSDDESHPLRFERQLRCFAEHPDLDLLATDAVNSFEHGAHADWDVPPGPDRVVAVDRQLLTRNVLVHTSVMARRSLFDRLLGYDSSRQRYFDYDLYLRARTIGAHMARLVTPLVLLRAHNQQSFAAERGVGRKLKDLYRLQIGHVRHEPAMTRYVYAVGICVRIPVRHVRGELRRHRRLAHERA
jgi:glycosyltransferase involved in cell wall biosynthesis